MKSQVDPDATVDLSRFQVVLCHYYLLIKASKDSSETRGNCMVNPPLFQVVYLAYCYLTVMKSAGWGQVDSLLPHRKREVVTPLYCYHAPIPKETRVSTRDR